MPELTKPNPNLDLIEIRQRLLGKKGRPAWRSLAELAETDEFIRFLHEEFPRETSWVGKLNRRDFLKLLAAPLAMAGLTACRPQPVEFLVPYGEAPDTLVPGKPLFFATAMELGGYGRGLLVENREGRPIKVEGNPSHPANLGATDSFGQGSILTLYDPARAQVISYRGDIRTWDTFQEAVVGALEQQAGKGGAGLRILTETVTSPTFSAQLAALLDRYPQASWHQYDPVGRDNVRQGAELAFGEIVETQYRVDSADVILCIDADLFTREPGSLRYIREFSSRRQPVEDPSQMNRLYSVESTFSITGASADHRLALPPSLVAAFARQLAGRLGVNAGEGPTSGSIPENWLEAVAADLDAHRGRSLVLAGPQQPAEVHAIVHAINQQLGNVGSTVFYTDPVEINPVNQVESLRTLVQDLQGGLVDILVIFSENPAYTAPADLNFIEAMDKAGLVIYHGLYENETSVRSDWHIPATHYLEMWSDVRAFDGMVSIIQPLIEPLYGSRSHHELMAILLGQAGSNSRDIVRQFWQSRFTGSGFEEAGFEDFWSKSLREGVIAGTEAPAREISLAADFPSRGSTPVQVDRPVSSQAASAVEIVFEPDPTIWDGRYYHNAWLQELPKPVTMLTWDNAALISPNTAITLNIENEQVVELHLNGRGVRAPVWILPGLPDNTVVVHLGYGQGQNRTEEDGGGFNAYLIRTTNTLWHGTGLEIRGTNNRYSLVTTQDHQSMEGRDLVRVATLAEYQENPAFAHEAEHMPEIQGSGQESKGEAAGKVVPEPPSLYPENEYPGNAWGMTINLNSCIGCKACVIACQAENNIPVVGKDQVQNGREMHWIRVDRYFAGSDLNNPDVYFEPVPCMHCETAPCEPVCPVAATVHSSEGLNEMVYSRCIGTRYCSNNCPYKVRRFNFLQFSEENVLPLKLLHNPDVTVRSRGVMEKCTYCVQRIAAARKDAKAEGREIADGEIVPACAQACPANAIVFGDINNENSQVRQLKEHPLNYGLLSGIGTQPRTTYLAKVRNPNPALSGTT